MAAASLVLALYLRVGPDIVKYDPAAWALDSLLFAAITLIFLRLTGLYRGIWRYASINDLFAITRAVTAAILVYTLIAFFLTRLEGAPRSVPAIQWFILIAL